MKIGDRVKVNDREPAPLLRGELGTVISVGTEVMVKLDDNVFSWNESKGYFSTESLDIISVKDDKNDIHEMAQRNLSAMLDEVHQFRNSVENGTLGDFSELGLLSVLLQILVRD